MFPTLALSYQFQNRFQVLCLSDFHPDGLKRVDEFWRKETSLCYFVFPSMNMVYLFSMLVLFSGFQQCFLISSGKVLRYFTDSVLVALSTESLSKLHTAASTNNKLRLDRFLCLCSQGGSLHPQHSTILPSTLCFLPGLLLLATLYQDNYNYGCHQDVISPTGYGILNTESILRFLFQASLT